MRTLTGANRKILVAAWVLVAFGIGWGILYGLRDIRIHAPMVAIVTWYAKPVFFTLIENNIADELALASLLVGLSMLTLGPMHRDARSGSIESLAWRASFKFNTLFQLLAILFLFGKAFLVAMIVNFFSYPVIYLIISHGHRDRPLVAKAPADATGLRS